MEEDSSPLLVEMTEDETLCNVESNKKQGKRRKGSLVLETPAKRRDRLARAAQKKKEHRKKRLENESPEKRRERLQKQAQREKVHRRKKLENESPDERRARLERQAQRKRNNRAKQEMLYRKKQRDYRRRRLEQETAEEKQSRLQKDNQRRREKRARRLLVDNFLKDRERARRQHKLRQETPEQRQIRLQKDAKRKRDACARKRMVGHLLEQFQKQIDEVSNAMELEEGKEWGTYEDTLSLLGGIYRDIKSEPDVQEGTSFESTMELPHVNLEESNSESADLPEFKPFEVDQACQWMNEAWTSKAAERAEKDRAYKKRKLAEETPEERQIRLQKDAQRKRENRARQKGMKSPQSEKSTDKGEIRETAAQKADRLQMEAEESIRRALEAEEKKAQRRAKIVNAEKIRIATETAEERAIRLAKRRERYHKNEEQKKRKAEQYKEKRMMETEEERDARRAGLDIGAPGFEIEAAEGRTKNGVATENKTVDDIKRMTDEGESETAGQRNLAVEKARIARMTEEQRKAYFQKKRKGYRKQSEQPVENDLQFLENTDFDESLDVSSGAGSICADDFVDTNMEFFDAVEEVVDAVPTTTLAEIILATTSSQLNNLSSHLDEDT